MKLISKNQYCRTEQATTCAHCFSLAFTVCGFSPENPVRNFPTSKKIKSKSKQFSPFNFTRGGNIPWPIMAAGLFSEEGETNSETGEEQRDAEEFERVRLYCLLTAW